MKTKKILTILLISLMLVTLLSGCGDDSSERNNGGSQSPTVSDVLEEGMAEADGEDTQERQSGVTEGAPDPEEIGDDVALSTTEGIDIDLTQLSSTMVYSEVFNIVSDPESFVGKVIKMQGSFTMYHDEATDKYYYGCIIQDATACCSQGLEFVPLNATVYPDDFPEEMSTITVTGTFSIYEEGEYKYMTLKDAYMEV
jgi:hypothetical protein